MKRICFSEKKSVIREQIIGLVLVFGFSFSALAQEESASRLSVGGYGEVAMTRNFYSDNTKRYVNASEHANDPSHGRFDIPHAVIYLGYDFGRGWTMGTEMEFEHGGTGAAYELESDAYDSALQFYNLPKDDREAIVLFLRAI